MVVLSPYLRNSSDSLITYKDKLKTPYHNILVSYGLMADYFCILTSNHYFPFPPYAPRHSHHFTVSTPALQTNWSVLYHTLLSPYILALSLLLGCLLNSHSSFKTQLKDFPRGAVVKNLPAMQEMWVWSMGQEDPPEREMATHSSILAWRIPWTEEPGRLQSMGLQKSQTWLTDQKKKENSTQGVLTHLSLVPHYILNTPSG